MKIPHKHAEVIKAWADGKDIQFRFMDHEPWITYSGGWMAAPCFHDARKWRIKPPDPVIVIRHGKAFMHALSTCVAGTDFSPARGSTDNLKLTFEDGKLIAAEVLK